MSLRIVFLLVALMVAAPVAAFDHNHFFVIRSKLDGRVLTAEGDAGRLRGQAHVPTGVAMRPENGSPAQLWYVERAPGAFGNMGMVYIRNYLGGRVLDVEGWQTNVITYAKKNEPAWNQLWRIDGNRILSLRATHHWQCLDVLYANWRYGPGTGRWDCHGRVNQQWEWVRKERIVSMGNVPGRITLANAGGVEFARPITPWEADAGGIEGHRSYTGTPDNLIPYVRVTWNEAVSLCRRLVVNGIANWRLPTWQEFRVLGRTYVPSGPTTVKMFDAMGWIAVQHWTSQESGWDKSGGVVYHPWYPDEPMGLPKWFGTLASCVR